MLRTTLFGFALLVLTSGPSAAENAAPSIRDAIAVLRSASGGDQGQSGLTAAWRRVAALPADRLTMVLAAMEDCGPLAENWLRAAVDAIAERELAAHRALPREDLEDFVLDRDRPPRARRLAFEWLAKIDDTATGRLVPGMIDDPSLELRFLAVAEQMTKAATLTGAESASAYRVALEAARDLRQVEACAKALKESGIDVNLARQFGFITDWHLIGVFDNKDRAGFAAVYPPEREVDLKARYESLDKQVGWIAHHTEHKLGKVDLNKVYGEIKEVVAYAASDVTLAQATDAELRLSCIAALKVWVNGALVANHEIYHAGSRFDQYRAVVPLKAGRNRILVKVCQNEQTQSWANVWTFSARVCDASGGALAAAQIGNTADAN